jgi:hypothetical protein
MSRTITCEACRKMFESSWSDEEAKTEFAIEFQEESVEDGAVVYDFNDEAIPYGVAVVCDDCYQVMMAMFRPRVAH